MTSLNFSLPEPMRDWIDAQIKSGRYGNVSEYIRELIRRDQERMADQRLEQLLLAGLDSGPANAMSRADWAKLRRDVVARAKKLKGKKARGR